MIPRCAWNCKILKTRQKKKYWRGNYWILILRQWTVLLVRIRLFSWLCPSEQMNPRKIDSLTVIFLLLHWIFLISSQSKTRYCLLSVYMKCGDYYTLVIKLIKLKENFWFVATNKESMSRCNEKPHTRADKVTWFNSGHTVDSDQANALDIANNNSLQHHLFLKRAQNCAWYSCKSNLTFSVSQLKNSPNCKNWKTTSINILKFGVKKDSQKLIGMRFYLAQILIETKPFCN